MLIIKRKLYSKNLSGKSKSILVIKRFSQNHKFYSNRLSTKQTMRIKRFSMMNEEERLYANPFATIRRVNNLRTANNAYKGLNFRQALSLYRQRGQLATTARSIHKPMVSGAATNGRLDTRSLRGGILYGTNIGKSNLVGLSAGVKQASSNISSNVRSSSGGGLFKSLFKSNNSADSIMRKDIFKTANPIISQHITQSKNFISGLRNAGVTNANIGNLTGTQKNQLLNPSLQKSSYNPALDPKTLNTNFMGSGQIPVQKGTKQQTLIDDRGFEKVNKSQRRTSNSVLNQEANQLSTNNQRGQSYYESVFKETGADANSMNNTTLSRSKAIEQQTQPQSQPQPIQEKPFETPGLKEQPKQTSTPVENNNPVSQTTSNPPPVETFKKSDFNSIINNTNTPPVITTNQQTSENQTTTTSNKKADDKFKLGWKGKLALGAAGLGAATYGGAKLVGNMLKDEDEK